MATLALVSARPSISAGVALNAAWAALLSGGLAAAAVVLDARGARRPARALGGLAALGVAGFSGFLVWLSMRLAS